MIARILALLAIGCALATVPELQVKAAEFKVAAPVRATKASKSVPLPRARPLNMEIGKTAMPSELGGARRKYRGAGRRIRGAGGGGAEAGLDGSLRSEIARLRALYGPGAVRVIGGAAHRNVAGTNMLSCHSGGHAFDGYLSATAMAALRRTSFGIITYSGHHNHVHVSSCARERGLRAHNSGNGAWSAGKRWKKKKRVRRYR